MIGFKKFCETARQRQRLITTSLSGEIIRASDLEFQELQKIINKANIFVFEGNASDFDKIVEVHASMKKASELKLREKGFYEEGEPDPSEPAINIDMPFEVCFFEAYDSIQNRQILPKMKGVDQFGNEYIMSEQIGVLVVEISPTKYREYMLLTTIQGGKTQGSFILLHNSVSKEEIDGWLDRIKRDKIGIESIKEKIKTGTKSSDIKFRIINKVVRVIPKKYSAHVKPLFSKEINYSHRWEVRGHWRALNGIGKNRTGDYCVAGFTWVKEHEKGPEGLPVVKKTRLIINEKTVTPYEGLGHTR